MTTDAFEHLGTFADEQAYARRRGWIWTPGDVPQIPNRYGDPGTVIFEDDPHNETESDGLECALCLLKRLGLSPGDGSRHAHLVENHLRFFRADLRPADPTLWTSGNAWYRGSAAWVNSCNPGVSGIPDHAADQVTRRLPDHFYVGGLFQTFMLTGDRRALAEGLALVTDVENWYLRRALDGSTNPIEVFDPVTCPTTARGMARHWKGVCWAFKATRDERWRSMMHRIARIAFSGSVITPGVWLNLMTTAYPGYPYGVSSIHHAIFDDALWLTRALTDDQALKAQCEQALVGMADFAKVHGLNPATQLAPYQYHLKASALPRIEITYHGMLPSDGLLSTGSGYTTSWLNTLARASRITGDRSYLDAAERFWFNVSHHGTDTPIGTGPDIPASQFGRFMDLKMDLSTSRDLYAKGESVLGHEMWRDLMAVVETRDPITSLKPGQSVALYGARTPRVLMRSHTVVDAEPTLIRSPTGRSYTGFVVHPNGDADYFGGADQSHEGNDLDKWRRRKLQWDQLYPPEPQAVIGASDSPLVSPLGRPETYHAYGRQTYDETNKRLLIAPLSGLWSWPDDDSGWVRLTAVVPPSEGIQTKCLAWDPDLADGKGGKGATLWLATTGFDRGVFRYDGGDTWTKILELPHAISWGEPHMAYHRKKKVWLLSYQGGPGAGYYVLDLAAKTVTKIDAPIAPSHSMSYDEQAERVLILDMVWDVEGPPIVIWTWDGAAITKHGILPGPVHRIAGGALWGKLRYAREDGVHLFLDVRSVGAGGTGGNEEDDVVLWAYKFGPADAPPPPPPPDPEPGVPMKVTNLGVIQGDIAPGTPDDALPISDTLIPNWRLKLEGLTKRPQSIRVVGAPTGEWRSPSAPPFWGIRLTVGKDTVDLQGCVFQSVADFSVSIDGGPLVHAETGAPPPPPPPPPPPGPTTREHLVQAKTAIDAALASLKETR